MNSRTYSLMSVLAGLLAILTLLYDVGFEQGLMADRIISSSYLIYLLFFAWNIPFTNLYFEIGRSKRRRSRIWITGGLLWLLVMGVLVSRAAAMFTDRVFLPILERKAWLALTFSLCLLLELSRLITLFKYRKFNPALLFVSGFFALILTGTFMLLMPRATISGISLTDAFFTSTSAVCVTGLIVVDTGSCFTRLGQSMIMILIQLGGLGIMTFTSFFVLFFSGGATYRSLIIIGDLTSEKKIASVFGTLLHILVFTLVIEAAGVLLIHSSLKDHPGNIPGGRTFFSIFHAISAFCNAGFSTIPLSLYDIDFRFNYPLHLTVALLFITGGLGFPVIANLFQSFRLSILRKVKRVRSTDGPPIPAQVISLHTRIVLRTTFWLIIAGTLAFLILEYRHTLSEHHGPGKVITAFFGAVTPRTAGFNTVDTSSLQMTTMVLVIVLMWIGASPGSTGGGIKTSAFALAIMNARSLISGRNRVEFAKREISANSLNRASAFMILSLMVISSSILILLVTDPGIAFADAVFEVFSAFSTVGLSRGVTPGLSLPGKYLIIITMFIGRVGTLTLLVAFFRKLRNTQYRYPSEEILIN